MPLPSSGEISIRDINVEISSTQPTVTRDLGSAGIIFELDVDPNNWSDGLLGLGIDEFYGLSLTDLEVDPDAWQFPNTGGPKVFEYTSRAGVPNITSNRAYFVLSSVGTSIPTGSFTVTAGDNSAVGSPARSGSITVTNTTTTVTVPITQNAGPPPEITIDPNIREVGGLTTSVQFQVDTTAPNYIVSATPSFVTGTTISGDNLFVTLSLNNEVGAQTREGNITVRSQTGIPGATEAEDSALIRQFATAVESIVVSGPSGIPNTGQLNVDYDVETVDEYGTIWNAGVIPLNPGDDISWITNIRQFYDSGTSGDGTIRVDIASNPVGSPSKFAQITAISPGVPVTNQVVQLESNAATLSLDPTDNVDININGGGSFVVTTNAPWSISYTNSSFLPAGAFSPSSGNAGVTTVTVSANPRPIGFDNPRQQDITVQTATGLIDVVIDDYTLIQPANPATISITPTSRTISGYVQSTVFFSVSSNTTWQLISWPSFVPFGNITVTSNSITAIVPAQPYGANPERSGNFVVETTTAADDKQATATLTQQATEDEFITVSGDSTINATGQQNEDYTVTTLAAYSTVWLPSITAVNPGDDVSWATIDSYSYNNGINGDGTIRVDFASNVVGGSSRFVYVTATKQGGGVVGTQFVQQGGIIATIGATPSSVSLNIAGTGQNISVTSNTSWAFSSIASWINVSPSTGTGNTTVNISADPVPVGTASTRSDNLTLSTTSPGGNDVSTTVSVDQPANPATITLTPNGSIGVVGSSPSPVSFGVSTNASDYSISAPAYVSISGKTISGFTATWSDNTTGSPRSGTITVTTITGLTEASDDCDFTQAAITIPSLSISGTSTAPTAGSTGNVYTITTNYSFGWSVSSEPVGVFNQIPITFTTSTSGNGNGQVEVTFGVYNGDGTETLRSAITVSTTIGGTTYSDSVTVSQSPPPLTTYYIFDPCDSVTWSTVMVDLGSAPSSNERAVGGFSNYYTYSGTTTTNASAYPIASLTLEGVTGCPPAPSCTSYQVFNESNESITFGFEECSTGNYTTRLAAPNRSYTYCARTGTLERVSGGLLWSETVLGSCT